LKRFAEGKVDGVAVVGPSPNPHREWSYELGTARRVQELAGCRLDFWNLFPVEPINWNPSIAAVNATTWRMKDREYDTLILLGAKVRDAFGLRHHDWLDWCEVGTTHMALVLPHPSGLNRWWNDIRNTINARNKIREIISDGSPIQ
jgi:hypothetical protein